MKLEKKLVLLRKEKGLTQLELAEAVSVSRQAVSKWEAGRTIPSIENLRGLSELYGVPVDYLLNESNKKGTENSADNKDIPWKNQGRMKGIFIKWYLVIILLLIVTGLTWLLYNNSEKHFSVKDMVGEEVVDEPDGSFSVGW